MSESYQIFVLLLKGFDQQEAVQVVNEVLTNLGGELDSEDSLLLLHETETEEPEPEYIINPAQALEKLATWPTYGAIVYFFSGISVTVSFEGEPSQKLVLAVTLSMGQRSFEAGGQETQSRFKSLALSLHESLGASRTIMDWGLEYKGFDWKAELARISKGQFFGSYQLIDLRKVNS